MQGFHQETSRIFSYKDLYDISLDQESTLIYNVEYMKLKARGKEIVVSIFMIL